MQTKSGPSIDLKLRKNWWRILFLTVIAILIVRQGHAIDNTPLPIGVLPFSSFSKAYGATGVEIYIAIWFLMIFCCMSVTFLIAEKWMRGGKIAKGLAFGVSWGMIYLMGVIEWYPVFGKTSLIADIRLGMVDVLGIIVVGILSGVFFASDGRSGKANIKNSCIIISLIAAAYIVGKYFAYSILGIVSGYIERPVATLVWTLLTGLSFGTFYILAGRNVGEKNLIKRAVFYGLAIIGPNWLIFNLFYPGIFQGSFLDFIFGRAIVDTIFAALGAYLGERLVAGKAEI
jgi:hypothetical protein